MQKHNEHYTVDLSPIYAEPFLSPFHMGVVTFVPQDMLHEFWYDMVACNPRIQISIERHEVTPINGLYHGEYVKGYYFHHEFQGHSVWLDHTANDLFLDVPLESMWSAPIAGKSDLTPLSERDLMSIFQKF